MLPDDLLNRLDAISGDLREVKADLRHHIRRTELNEESLTLLRSEVEPLKTHVAMWGGAGKLLAVLVALAGLGFTAMKVWG
jgi:hypothetical protein